MFTIEIKSKRGVFTSLPTAIGLACGVPDKHKLLPTVISWSSPCSQGKADGV